MAGAVAVAPYFAQNLVSCPDHPWRLQQVREQVDFRRGEADESAVDPRPAPRHVDLDATRAQHLTPCGALCPAEQHPDPGRQLAHAERLGQVVVGTDLKAPATSTKWPSLRSRAAIAAASSASSSTTTILATPPRPVDQM
jgi:hypothetical protein